ncbi:MAG: response regulator [Candidatus Omnitrophica bacterium]|nr:response regulator [Candidatus Omnitrophota bacterium]
MKKILVIDDDPVSVKLMESGLAKAGYEVFLAGNGEKGLMCAQEKRPDLIITDVEMPEMNGYTFVLEAKKIDAIKDTPVIVLTAHEENKPIFLRKGIQHYMVKPVDFAALLEKLKELVGA